MKVTGMLVVSLRSVNCRFWTHLGFWDGKLPYLPIQVFMLGVETLESRGPINWFFLKNERSKLLQS